MKNPIDQKVGILYIWGTKEFKNYWEKEHDQWTELYLKSSLKSFGHKIRKTEQSFGNRTIFTNQKKNRAYHNKIWIVDGRKKYNKKPKVLELTSTDKIPQELNWWLRDLTRAHTCIYTSILRANNGNFKCRIRLQFVKTVPFPEKNQIKNTRCVRSYKGNYGFQSKPRLDSARGN